MEEGLTEGVGVENKLWKVGVLVGGVVWSRMVWRKRWCSGVDFCGVWECGGGGAWSVGMMWCRSMWW